MRDPRVLTVHQPWADLLLLDGDGRKDVENRSRPVPSTLPRWMTCLGCYATRGPDESLTGCDCDLGYLPTPDRGIIDPDHAYEWVPSNEVAGAMRTGRFPFRLGIHAGKTVDRDALRALPDHVYTQTTGVRGVLLGFVTVTGCHHADECRRVDHPRGYGTHVRWCSRWAMPDQYHIVTADPVRLDEPIPMRGYQGWWRLPDGIDVPT